MNLDQMILKDFNTATAVPESVKLAEKLDHLPTSELLKLAGFSSEPQDLELQKKAAIGQIMAGASKLVRGAAKKLTGGGAAGRMAAAEKTMAPLQRVAPSAASKATAAAANTAGGGRFRFGGHTGAAANSNRARMNQLKVAQVLESAKKRARG